MKTKNQNNNLLHTSTFLNVINTLMRNKIDTKINTLNVIINFEVNLQGTTIFHNK